MSRASVATLAALSLVVGLWGSAAAQEEERQGFVDIVDVEVVEVDVQVTDREGRPITGLTVEDFAVFEDGGPVVVTNFREVSTAAVAAPAAADDAVQDPGQEAPRQVDEAAPAAAAPRPAHMVIFVDNANIRALHRRRVLRDLRRFIYQMREPFRMMVVSLDRRVNVRQGFTDSRSEVIEALLELDDENVYGDTARDEFRDLLHEIESPESPSQSWLESKVRGHAQAQKHELDRSLRSMGSLIDSLAGLPGRKALVHVTDGLPLTPAEELFHALEQRYEDLTVLHGAMLFNSTLDFERLAQRANTAGVVFYSLHAAGLEAPTAGQADVAGSGLDGLRSTVDSVRAANFQGSGRMLAAATGGMAMLNQNDYRVGLERMVQDFNHYYSLGYRPRSPGDGRYHKIEVKLVGRKAQVRHREGYRDRSLAERMEAVVRTAVNYVSGDNPLDIDVDVVPATAGPGDDGNNLVTARVGIPMARLALVPQGDWFVGRTLLFVAVRSSDGSTSPVQEVNVPIRIAAERIDAALEQRWVQEVNLRVRPGPQLLVVGIWDELARNSSVTFRRFKAAT